MSQIDLLLRILNAANLLTPTLGSIINTIKGGRAAGKTDEEIQKESMSIALGVRSKSEKQMSNEP